MKSITQNECFSYLIAVEIQCHVVNCSTLLVEVKSWCISFMLCVVEEYLKEYKGTLPKASFSISLGVQAAHRGYFKLLNTTLCRYVPNCTSRVAEGMFFFGLQ